MRMPTTPRRCAGWRGSGFQQVVKSLDNGAEFFEMRLREALSMGIPLLAASVIGTAVLAAGSYRAAQYQAGVMKQNAQVATNNAMIAENRGRDAAAPEGMKTAQEVGQQSDVGIAGSWSECE